ncbi:site-specific integrase [uncultured Xylophilus sp.]|uniref:tyrosine-type recombinase/integrase n=1 Tax=uncultured Xylophilus sp. TaxID=296832 RepID=UPI0025F4E6F1|nr:site-specific integrase [uncultured Xylophilus sp.]
MAAVWEAEAITEVLLRGTKPMNLHAVLDAFLAARKDKVGGINARVHLRHFYEIADQRMSKVTLQDLNAVIEKRRKAGTAHNTLAVTVSYWNAVVNYAEAQKWTTAIKLPRLQAERTRLRFLTVEEEAALFATIDPTADYPGKCARSDAARQNNTDLLIGLLHLGCRYREIARMKWSQVDFDTGLVVVYRGKGGIDSSMVMSARLRAMLTRRRAEATDEWVFPTKRKHNNNFAWMQDALARAGISDAEGKVTLHTMRHSYASRMLQGGMKLREVQELLGHKHYASTLIYAHLESGVVANRAAEILNGQ